MEIQEGFIKIGNRVDNVKPCNHVVVTKLKPLFGWCFRNVLRLRDHVLVGEGLSEAAGQRERQVRDGVLNVSLGYIAQGFDKEFGQSTDTWVPRERVREIAMDTKSICKPAPISNTLRGRRLPKLESETSDLKYFAASWFMLVNAGLSR